MKYCPKCQIEYSDKFAFCKKCGQKLEIQPQHFQVTSSNTEPENSIGNKRDSKKWMVIGVVVVALLVFFAVGGNTLTNKNTQGNIPDMRIQKQDLTKNTVNSSNSSSMVLKKSLIPDGYMAVDVVGRNIYLPKNFIRIKEEEKMFDTSSVNSSYNSKIEKAGVALYGLIDNNGAGENNILKRYEVVVSFSQSPSFQNLKPHIEDKSFEEAFKGTKNMVSQSADFRLISKEICKNNDGHRYLKVVYVVSEKGNPDNKLLIHYAVTYFDGTMYGIFLRTPPETNGKFDRDFNIILNTFGTIR